MSSSSSGRPQEKGFRRQLGVDGTEAAEPPHHLADNARESRQAGERGERLYVDELNGRTAGEREGKTGDAHLRDPQQAASLPSSSSLSDAGASTNSSSSSPSSSSSSISSWPGPISRIAKGHEHTLIISGGRVMAFGSQNKIGFEDRKARSGPTEVLLVDGGEVARGLFGAVDACAGAEQSAVVLEDGRLFVWGEKGGGGENVDSVIPIGLTAASGEWEKGDGFNRGQPEEVSAGSGFALIRLNNNDLIWFGNRFDSGTLLPPIDPKSPFSYPELNSNVIQLPKSYPHTHASVLETEEGLVGGGMATSAYYMGGGRFDDALVDREKSKEEGKLFSRLKTPHLVDGRWCKVPPEARQPYRAHKRFQIPFEAIANPEDYKGRNELPRWMEAGDFIRFSCASEGGVLHPPEAHLQEGCECTQLLKDRKMAHFVPSPSELECRGCEVEISSDWTEESPLAPRLPLVVQVKRQKQNGEGGEELEGEYEEYEKGRAVGVGDLVRLLCEGGKLEASTEKDRKGIGEGVECRRFQKDEKEKKRKVALDLDDSSSIRCVGCKISEEWQRGKPSGSFFRVDISRILRSGQKEDEEFDRDLGVAVNDSLIFSCPDGGILTNKRATCIRTESGEVEFDLNTDEVKCVVGRSARLMQVLPWALLLIALCFGTFFYILYATKENRRRLKMRRLFQVSITPPQDAGVEDMRRETAFNPAYHGMTLKARSRLN
uniref:Uncharacterized protein n=1 Tax=Chromera velia CCMP2878 TaxID=1169474 RepID=A0A0G4HLS3_9ALVE|eukprot:Cvel_28927.t1-p1 / transcript=Cvel_28927.t1 / gene=Cvel_28927 / organism=Chromera_velia_CCMP2878 / gene_product=hypothetical protein / transcript_product=hypothetical protein / location=Cvel_scaffold3873:2966-9580(-) / protein_length=716 / sequence_SO=supercontig / SO=protein_coding / is_pseudo=false